MSTQYNNETVYGGFFVRLAAFIIDWLIVGSVLLVLKLMFSMVAFMLPGDLLTTGVLFQYSIVDIILYLLGAAYFVLCTYFTRTTLGKKLMHLEVITKDQDDWNFMNILYRETIGRYINSLACIGYIVLGIDKEKRGFHDMLCDTRVVYTCKMRVKTQTPKAVQPQQPPEQAVQPEQVVQPVMQQQVPVQQPIENQTQEQ